jgi:hypothetical protein
MNVRQLLLIIGLVSALSTICFWYPREEHPAFRVSDRTRFPVAYGLKWGYIDAQGELKIQPAFYAAGDFHEGLAAVRKGGLYGYIDATGNFIIPEQFDFAEEFKSGMARVYTDGRPQYIDHAGKIVFTQFEEITSYGPSCAVARTPSGKYCLVDPTSYSLLTDTIFGSIEPFREGAATAYVIKAWKGDAGTGVWDTNFTACVIDSAGNWMINPGTYTAVTFFSEGKALARQLVKDSTGAYRDTRSEFIDRQGEVLFSVLDAPYSVYQSDGFSDGRLIVSVWDSARSDYWPGVINDRGELLFTSTELDEILPYQNGFAFARKSDAFLEWIMIDAKGNELYPVVFEEVYRNRAGHDLPSVFNNGRALVKMEKGWCMLGADGRPIDSLCTSLRQWRVKLQTPQVVVLRDTAEQLWFVNERRVIDQQYAGIDQSTVNDRLIRVQFSATNDAWGYITRYGHVVWRSTPQEEEPAGPLNIDFMANGYFRAATVADPQQHEGWAASANYYRSLDTIDFTYTRTKFQMYIDTMQHIRWADRYNGYRVYLINDSADTVFFNAQDSRINAIVQAKDAQGVWRDIENLLSSWCGNSYHTLYLPEHKYWTFTMPQYEGTVRTELRVKLWYNSSPDLEDEDILYSNAISGSVNPAQFWRKREYISGGIMDPYSQ